jgi:sRNA-binding carbon storage regulator CsrA
VCRINGNQVSVAITAARSVHVIRDELVTGYVAKPRPKK